MYSILNGLSRGNFLVKLNVFTLAAPFFFFASLFKLGVSTQKIQISLILITSLNCVIFVLSRLSIGARDIEATAGWKVTQASADTCSCLCSVGWRLEGVQSSKELTVPPPPLPPPPLGSEVPDMDLVAAPQMATDGSRTTGDADQPPPHDTPPHWWLSISAKIREGVRRAGRG